MIVSRLAFSLICLSFLMGCQGPASQDNDIHVADVAIRNGSPDVALAVTRKYLQQHPNNAHALCIQGNAEALKDQVPQADASFNRALALSRNENCALLGLGRLKLRASPQEAAALLERAVHLSADTAALVDLAIAYDLQGQHSKAQALYTQVIAASPENTNAVINMGLSLALSGKADSALSYLEPMIQKGNCSNRVRGDAAFAMVQAGHIRDAEILLRTYLSEEETKKTLRQYAEFR